LTCLIYIDRELFRAEDSLRSMGTTDQDPSDFLAIVKKQSDKHHAKKIIAESASVEQGKYPVPCASHGDIHQQTPWMTLSQIYWMMTLPPLIYLRPL
jgi:hypothetical protein